jgi:membrane protein implicated in regulation of membrane protease activity
METLTEALEALQQHIAAWHVWVLLAIALAIAELLGTHFVLFALALSCLAGAAVAAWTPWGLNAQVGATLVAAMVLTPVMVQQFRRQHARAPGPLDEGWESGREAVLEEYAGRLGVRLRGDFFPARSVSGQLPEAGARVLVTRIEGITAWVEQPPPSHQQAKEPTQ